MADELIKGLRVAEVQPRADLAGVLWRSEPARTLITPEQRLRLNPELFVGIGGQASTPPQRGGAPQAGTRSGSVFTDLGDPLLLWYLSELTLAADPDALFAFDARQDDQPNEEGELFNRATVTIGVTRSMPADATERVAATPGARLQEISVSITAVALTLPFRGSDDSQREHRIPGVATPTPDGYALAFPALLGDVVAVGFADLATNGAAIVTLSLGYEEDVVTREQRWSTIPDPHVELVERQPDLTAEPILVVVDRPGPQPPIEHPEWRPDVTPIDQGEIVRLQPERLVVRQDLEVAQPQFELQHATRLAAPHRAGALARQRTKSLWLIEQEDAPEVVVRIPALAETRLPVGTKYASTAYRPRYTVTADGTTRAIVTGEDLRQFDGPRSEFQELTVFGDVGATYPSLRALYVGLVSGTVVAIPAVYGIQRTALGCEASCDALVDSGSAQSSGSRFRLSFAVGPIVDPGDLARLAADVAASPTLTHRRWSVVLPTSLDPRTPPSFASELVSASTFGTGLVPGTFTVGVDIVDDAPPETMPAVAKVSSFLRQLSASGPAPLRGRIALRLDEAHAVPVEADVVLDLRYTAGGAELGLADVTDDTFTVRNVAPYDVRLRSYTTDGDAGLATVPQDVVVPGSGGVTVPRPGSDSVVGLFGALELADPLPRAQLARYVTFRTTDVDLIHHLLGVNATTVLPEDGTTRLNVAIALDDAPGLSVPEIALDGGRRVDRVTIEIPVQSAITGLGATVTVTVSPEGVDPTVHSFAHDFAERPILVLGPEQIGMA